MSEACRILVVEDHPPARTALMKLLAQGGFDVQGTSSISETRAKLQWQPHVVVLDLFLSDGCSIELVPVMRRAVPDVTIALVTGAVQDPVAFGELERLKPEAIFRKPIQARELFKWVREVCEPHAPAGVEQPQVAEQTIDGSEDDESL